MTERDEVERFISTQTDVLPMDTTEVIQYYTMDFTVTHQDRTEPMKLSMAGKEIIRFRPVSTLDDIENLRLIRNECREQMTHTTEEIDQGRQLLWWQAVAGNPKWHVWLVYVPGWDEAVGFALLRKAAIRWFVTLGLRPWMRGQGYGTLIYRMLREIAPVQDVWAVIRENNVASIRAAEKAGYVRADWTIAGQIGMVGRRAKP